ncbi:peptide ABC transporter substrate-binding protein [Rubeoparvulum massiliense]|uniref:peptide ABC transporter substrate-binding protein n=1 Tax=Rubeoparvulum massiliense TaxID=1631346 RepID=UPI00065E3AF6|nr:peptide ABC transporter substrate-binding protein [Rubeoparvulum massiliense]
MNLRKASLLFLATIMLFSVVLAGCGGNDKNEGAQEENTATEATPQELHLMISDEPLLDPQKISYAFEFTVVANVMEGLVRLGENEKVVPGMAETWETSEDGLTWTFNLRDAKWSDGSAVTADDFVYGWNRATSPDVAAIYSYIVNDHVSKVEAVDEKTLQVTLKNPTPYFESLMAFATFFPAKKDFVEAQGAEYGTDADKLLYNGPFVLKEWNHNNKLILAKNENYWDAETVQLDTITLDIIKDGNAALSLYEEGSLDQTGLAREQVVMYQDSPEFNVESQANLFWIIFNTKNPALQNANIRKALSYGYDRQAYIDVILNNGAKVATGLVPEGIPGPGGKSFREVNGDLVTYDEAKAKEYLEQGLKELGMDKLPTITYIGYDNDSGIKGAEFLKENYKKIGVDVKIENLPVAAVKERKQNGDFDIFFTGWGPDYWDAMTFLDVFVTDGPNNDGKWSNAEFDQLIAAARVEADPEKRLQYMVDAEKILIQDDAAIAPVFFKSVSYLKKPYVKNVIRHQFGYDEDWKWASIEGK